MRGQESEVPRERAGYGYSYAKYMDVGRQGNAGAVAYMDVGKGR